jgi:preprotein translocase subunit SecG
MILALTILFFLVSVVLITVVLIQPGGSGGMGIFGGGSQSAFGTKTGNVMTKFTTVLAALFLLVSFILGYLNSRQGKVETKELIQIEETVGKEPQQEEKPGVQPDVGIDISDTNR